MPSRPCTATTTAGKPCRAWAVHGTEPPLCSAHARRNTGAGAPRGNQNALKHGFYRSALTPQEVADLLTHAQNESIADELALVRVMLRRLMHYLQHPIPDLDHVPEDMPPNLLQFLDEGSRLTAVAPLVYRGARTVAYLRQRMEPGGGLRHILEEVLDDLSANFEVDL